MRHRTRRMVADIINDIPTANFDTHRIEKRVLRRHAVAFAEDLLEFRTTDDPLKRFSAAFSQWVGRTFANEVTKSTNDKVVSETSWRRRGRKSGSGQN